MSRFQFSIKTLFLIILLFALLLGSLPLAGGDLLSGAVFALVKSALVGTIVGFVISRSRSRPWRASFITAFLWGGSIALSASAMCLFVLAERAGEFDYGPRTETERIFINRVIITYIVLGGASGGFGAGTLAALTHRYHSLRHRDEPPQNQSQ